MKKIGILAVGLAMGYMLARFIDKINVEVRVINNDNDNTDNNSNDTDTNEEETGELERNITDEIIELLNNNPEIIAEDVTNDDTSNNTLDDIFGNKNIDFPNIAKVQEIDCPDIDEIQEDELEDSDDSDDLEDSEDSEEFFDDLVKHLDDVSENSEGSEDSEGPTDFFDEVMKNLDALDKKENID